MNRNLARSGPRVAEPSRRAFLGLGAAAFGAAFLPSCGGDNTQSEGTGTLRYPTPFDPEGDDPRGQAERRIFELFEERTGIRVVEDVTPWQNIDPNLLAAVQAGNPPEISRVNYYNFQRHVSAGSLVPLQEMADNDYSEEELSDFVVQLEGEQGIEAFLIENIGNALYLRQDWLDAAGLQPPTTWGEFVTIGQELKARQPDIGAFLTFGSTAESGQVAYIFQPMIAGRGGRILDDDGRAVFNEDPGVETYEFLRSLVHDHGVMSVDAATTAYRETSEAFIAGRVGMIIEGSQQHARITAALGAENVTVVQIPGVMADASSPCIITGWTIAIPQGSPDVENAWELMKHRTDPEMQEIWAEVAGGLPTRRSTLERPFFQGDEANMIRWWLEYMETNSQLAVAPEANTELNEIMAEALQEVLQNPGTDVREVLDRAAERYNSAIA